MNIKTDRESAERLIVKLRNPLMLRKSDHARAADTLLALLDRAEAAEAEVARLKEEVRGWAENAVYERGRANGLELEVTRLSTPPDDAEMAELIPLLTDRDNPVGMKAADAITRMSHANAAERKLADDLIGIVEGIDGAMNHGTWRDDKGMRLKDTPQWVALYVALATPAPDAVQEAARVPEIAALIEAAKAIDDNYTGDCGCDECNAKREALDAALRAIAGDRT